MENKNKVTKFVVDRAKWFRGKGSNASRLLVSTGENKGMMCCLGFYSRACKVSEKRISDVTLPSEIKGVRPSQMKWLFEQVVPNSNWLIQKKEGKLAEVNDSLFIAHVLREKEIKNYFAEQGITVVFKGKTPKQFL